MTRTVLKLKKPRTLLKLKTTPQVKTSKKGNEQPNKNKNKNKKKPPKYDSTPKIKYKVLEKQCKAFLAILHKNHPDLFPNDETPAKPWRIGLEKEVKKRYDVTKKVARGTLNYWQNRNKRAYRAVLIPGAHRYNLDMTINGTVLTAWQDKKEDVKKVSADPV